MAVVAFGGCVHQKPVAFHIREPDVAAAAANKGPADVAVEEDGLLRTVRLRDVEDEEVGVFVPTEMLPNRDPLADLVALAQGAQEVPLHLVHFQHANDLDLVPALPDAEDEVAALGIGERGDAFVGASGYVAAGCLELHIPPFVGAEQLDEFLLGHEVIPGRCGRGRRPGLS